VIILSLLIVDSEGAITDPKTNPPLLKRAFNRRAIKRMFEPQYRGIYWRVIKGRLRGLATKIGGGSDRWASRTFLRDMKATVDARIPILIAFGSEEPIYEYFKEAQVGATGRLMEKAGDQVRVDVLGRDIKRLVHLDDQDALVEAMPEWVAWVEARSSDTS
jgi:hypothetical protein